MKALSISQPWTELILAGEKLIENRKWATKVRGRVLVHAPLSFDSDAVAFICKTLRAHERDDLRMHLVEGPIPRGALLGTVEILDCLPVEEMRRVIVPDQEPWAFGPFCYSLANATRFDTPIPWKGALGFFDVPDNVLASPAPTASGGQQQ